MNNAHLISSSSDHITKKKINFLHFNITKVIGTCHKLIINVDWTFLYNGMK